MDRDLYAAAFLVGLGPRDEHDDPARVPRDVLDMERDQLATA